ncbi:hypothetical protein AB832_04400 [Flavobacteriaceae bacterium (ex Bugula neritina AB1)]|nr:hypothetical protein AB832_04400 [Flavobacteriaceae bacterium (ex Bugula neritina AB1)]
MNIKFISYITLIFMILGCVGEEDIKSQIDNELNTLTTIDHHTKYLEKIVHKDQEGRKNSKKLLDQYGYESKEYNDAIIALRKEDELRLVKIERYLRKFGHPKKNKVGEIAASAPYLVIHHVGSSKGEEENNFEFLYNAYIQEDIDYGAFSFYLNRMYTRKYRKRHQIESPYKPEDEINSLIQKLNLADRTKKLKMDK